MLILNREFLLRSYKGLNVKIQLLLLMKLIKLEWIRLKVTLAQLF